MARAIRADARNVAQDLFRVGVAREDGEGAIDLFGQHDAREFVGHRQSGERNLLRGSGAEFVRKSFGVAAKEDEFAHAAVAKVAEPFGELLRRELFAGGVEEDDCGGGIEFRFAESGGRGVTELGDFEVGVAADARGVVVDECAAFFAAGFAEHEKADFHGISEA
jgi:hypothetical protein